jgi:hypothetical protein
MQSRYSHSIVASGLLLTSYAPNRPFQAALRDLAPRNTPELALERSLSA